MKREDEREKTRRRAHGDGDGDGEVDLDFPLPCRPNSSLSFPAANPCLPPTCTPSSNSAPFGLGLGLPFQFPSTSDHRFVFPSLAPALPTFDRAVTGVV